MYEINHDIVVLNSPYLAKIREVLDCSIHRRPLSAGQSDMSYSLYEDHIRSCVEDAQRLIADSQVHNSPVKLGEARQKLEEARAAVDELQREMFMLPTNERSLAQRRYQAAKDQIAHLEENVQNLESRQQLFGNSYNLQQAASVDQSLAQAARFGDESVAIGQGIIKQLSEQREKLIHAHGNVEKIHTSVRTSGGLVSRMEKIQRENKMITWAVVGLLVFAILLIFYLKFT